MSTILAFCPNLVGDTVMATPAFRALRLGFPDARIIAVVKPMVAPTLDGSTWFNDRIALDPRSSRPEERGPAALARMRQERADVAVLFPNSFRSAWLAWRAGASRRVGYARGGRGWLLTDRLRPIRDERGRFQPSPILDAYLELPRALGCPVVDRNIELFTTEADEAVADAAWSRLGLTLDRPVVCLNTGGAFGPAKSWPVEHFATLARKLVDEAGLFVLVVCGPAEREASRSIAAQANRPGIVSLADEPPSIGLTKACVRRSTLLITTDSGPRHFAAGFDVPVITLFGPTHVLWTLTYQPRSIHLRHPVPCGPCQQPTCPEGHHRCLRDLSPDSVFHAAIRLLKSSADFAELVEIV